MGSGSSSVNTLTNYRAIGELANRNVLSLFSFFNYWEKGISVRRQNEALGCLACIYKLGIGDQMSSGDLSKALGVSRVKLGKFLLRLSELGLVKSLNEGKVDSYLLTAKGVLVLMSFKEFQVFDAIKPLLCGSNLKDDRLGFAFLVLGYCEPNNGDVVFGTLVRYAEAGCTVESLSSDVVAESLLSFYSRQCRLSAVSLPNYLGVFKEFTTSGFQQVLQILLSSMKPAVEDYNWLVEFFGEVIEFYYNPVRLAYVNLLPHNASLKLRLEAFKKSQEQQIRKEGQTMEVTFNVPSSNVQKFMTMPAHLRAVATRLVLEPLQFINRELAFSFWAT